MPETTLTTIIDDDHQIVGLTPVAPYVVSVAEPARPSRSLLRHELTLVLHRRTLDCRLDYHSAHPATEREQLSSQRRARLDRRWAALRTSYDRPRLAAILDVLRWRLYGEARHDSPPTADIIDFSVFEPLGKWCRREHDADYLGMLLHLPLPRGPPPRLPSVVDDVLRYAMRFPRGSEVTMIYDPERRYAS